MKISESWLREWVSPDITIDELAAQITMAGLEVDGIEDAAVPFHGVVVGEIVAIDPHPDADKLRVCRVAGGPDGDVQVVCGAPNARLGLKTAFATVGAQLPGDFKINKAKLRGIESFGMLCSEAELGISDAAEGIWELPADAPTGANLRDYLELNDQLIEIDLTPNRGDCLSVRGVAREVGVLNKIAVTPVSIEAIAAVNEDTLPVELVAAEGCPRYAGRVIRKVDVSRPSPQWLQEKLRRSGLRSISPVVDITNYVMLELGQPMHAFDLDALQGGIRVRMAEEGEPLKLLDGTEVTLTPDTLVIADHSKAVAMAGIMGGADTAVSDSTKHIFFESAFFNPLSITGRPRKYGLHTDSSHRFERGVDPGLQAQAIERATALLLDITGGEPGPVIVASSADQLPKPQTVTLRRARLEQMLGLALPDETVVDILSRLGVEHLETSETGWVFRAPSWRFDIAMEADLIEEIARIYGYNHLPTATVEAALPIRPRREAVVPQPALREQLIARGYQEAITYSFVDPDLQRLFNPDTAPVILANPISADMSVMRTSLWPGLVAALRHNLNRQQSRVRLFETGLRFVPGLNELKQQAVIGGLITGRRLPESWAHNNSESVDFYDLKGDVEALLALTGELSAFSFARADHPALHPGQCAGIKRQGQIIGYVGKLHPAIQKQLEVDQDVYLFELLLEGITDARLPAFQGVSKFPEVRRDLALLLVRDIAIEDVANTVRQSAGDHLVDLKIFDVYQGKGIDNNRKSVAMGLIFRDLSRTLTEQEINDAVDRVVETLQQQYGATLRS